MAQDFAQHFVYLHRVHLAPKSLPKLRLDHAELDGCGLVT